MSDTTLAKIESLGLKLPEVPAPVAAYVNYVRSGNLLFLSGGLPIDGDVKILGKVPSVCRWNKQWKAHASSFSIVWR